MTANLSKFYDSHLTKVLLGLMSLLLVWIFRTTDENEKSLIKVNANMEVFNSAMKSVNEMKADIYTIKTQTALLNQESSQNRKLFDRLSTEVADNSKRIRNIEQNR